MIYRFGTSLYYANASRLIDDITALAAQGSPLQWMVLDCAAIGDVDYTASTATLWDADTPRQMPERLRRGPAPARRPGKAEGPAEPRRTPPVSAAPAAQRRQRHAVATVP